MAVIKCRAEVVESCYGLRERDERAVYPDGRQEEDGTYDPDSRTVVCDPCYIAIGMPPTIYIEGAIRSYRAAHGGGRV
jgi:hypothetical protein